MTRIAAVILAAGASTRLGEPKQLARLAGESLLERAVRVTADAGCDPIVVVLGATAEAVLAKCPLRQARIVVNDAWAEGMASSIRTGIASVAGQADAAILMTCDQPAVNPGHLRRLASRGIDAIIASAYAGRRGVPACFPASCFPDLLRLTGDQGARLLLASAESIELSGGELDIDTPESLKTARAIYEPA